MKCHGIGRLVRDPELKSVGDTHVCSFTLAMDRHYGKGENKQKETNFFDCVAWDIGAETIAKYCKKGHQLAVETTAVQDKWADKETGQKRSKIQFRVTNFTLLNNRKIEEAENQIAAEASTPTENAPF